MNISAAEAREMERWAQATEVLVTLVEMGAEDGDCWTWQGPHDADGWARWEGGLAVESVLSGYAVGLPAEYVPRRLPGCALGRACVSPHHVEVHQGYAVADQCPRGHLMTGRNLIERGGKRWCRACEKRRDHRRRGDTDAEAEPDKRCRRGHLLTETTSRVYVDRDGYRITHCLACRRANARQRYSETRKAAEPVRAALCKRGHPLEGEGSDVAMHRAPDGRVRRQCRACQRIRKQERKMSR